MQKSALAAFVLAGLLAVSQSAVASSIDGLVVVDGPFKIPTSSHVVSEPLALFVNGTDRLRIDVEIPEATVHIGKISYIRGETIQLTPPQQSVTSFRLTDLRITVLDQGDGWVGVFPTPGGTHASMTAAAAVEIEASTRSNVGNGLSTAEGPDPRLPAYSVKIDKPHLITTLTGEVEVQGRGHLKLAGPTVRLIAHENTTEYWTGARQSGEDIVHEFTRQWIIVEFMDARVGISSADPMTLAAERLTATWDGLASFVAIRGELRTVGSTYAATGEAVEVIGALQADFIPIQDRGSTRGAVSMSGDLRQTTMAVNVVLPGSPLGGSFGLPLMLAAVAVLAGGAGLVGFRVASRSSRNREEGAMSLDECVAMANLAAEAQRFGEALDWVRAARKFAPSSGRLALDEAFFAESVGEVDLALRLYSEASSLTNEGDGDFMAAQLHLKFGSTLDEVEAALEHALLRSPDLVVEVDGDPAFDPLRGRPGFRRIMRGARNRMTP